MPATLSPIYADQAQAKHGDSEVIQPVRGLGSPGAYPISLSRSPVRRRRYTAKGSDLDLGKAKARKTLGVGMAGRIKQELTLDSHDPGWWKSEPSAMITLHFVLEKEFDEILVGGYASPVGKQAGPFDGIGTV